MEIQGPVRIPDGYLGMSLRGRDEPRYCAPVLVTKGISRAVVVALLVGGGMASAEPRKAQARKAPSAAKVAAVKRSPVKAAPIKAEPAVSVGVPPEAMMQADALVAKIDPRMPAPSANAVMTHYQRVGREIIQLQNFRGTECTLELWKTFRAIKLEDATATKEARIATAATLQELQTKIARKKGITVKQECLDNPLAGDCL